MSTREQASSRTKAGRYRKGVSGNPHGRARVDAVQAHAPLLGLAPHADGWFNTITGLGVVGRDKAIAGDFEVDAVSSETALTIWRGDAIGARLVEVPVNEALREGFEVVIGDDEMPEHYQPPEPQAPPANGNAAPAGGPRTPTPTKPAAMKTDDDIAGKLNEKIKSTRMQYEDRAYRARLDAHRSYAKRHPSAYDRRIKIAVRDAHRRMDASDAKPLQEAVEKKLEQLQAIPLLKEVGHYERAYGGGALLIGANDFTTDMRVPLDLKKVRSFDYLTPLEGRELIPLYYYNDPHAPKFGQVAIYQLVPYVIGAPVDPSHIAPRVTQIHESRLIIFPGVRVSRRLMITSGTWGWGDSVFTRMIRALRAFGTSYGNAEVLLQDFAQAIYKVKGLADLVAKNPNALTDAMLNVELGRSICRAVVVDSEEDFERKSTTLAGYADLLTKFDQYLAAHGDVPLTLLMGTSPAGMNATGASDIRLFYDRVATWQTLRLAPAVMRIIEVILASMGEDPEKINHSVRFKALWQPTEKEVAEAHFTQAQADAIYLDRDVVSPEEMALSRFGGDQFSFETHVDFEARAAQEAMVAPTVEAKPFVYGDPAQTGFGQPMPEGAKTPQQRNIPPSEDEV